MGVAGGKQPQQCPRQSGPVIPSIPSLRGRFGCGRIRGGIRFCARGGYGTTRHPPLA